MLWAYLDPFTGSMILQILAAGFLGIVAFFRPIWNFFFGAKKIQADSLDDWDTTASNEEGVSNE